MKKTPFNEKELKEFKEVLLEKKARILKEIQEHDEIAHHEVDEPGDLVDMATELLEKELNLSLTEQERDILKEIDEALERIQNKTYGFCVDTGEAIAKTRLKALPEAKRTLEAQEKYDKIAREKKKRMQSSYR
ncbi:MAG: TraR/DksA C4-type zinc finger protein [Spirochaetia bacterium]|nr:TraR/DksA C4-type zinc finger protein [Spirochaetia bacterium]